MSIAGKLVEHLTDASLRKQMDTALLKIRSVLPRERQDYLDRLERSITVVPGEPGPVPRLSSEALIPVQRALAERRVLALDYQAGQARELTRREVEPLGLVYYCSLIAACAGTCATSSRTGFSSCSCKTKFSPGMPISR